MPRAQLVDDSLRGARVGQVGGDHVHHAVRGREPRRERVELSRRATSTTSCLSAAKSFASSSPRPADAPVMSAVFPSPWSSAERGRRRCPLLHAARGRRSARSATQPTRPRVRCPVSCKSRIAKAPPGPCSASVSRCVPRRPPRRRAPTPRRVAVGQPSFEADGLERVRARPATRAPGTTSSAARQDAGEPRATLDEASWTFQELEVNHEAQVYTTKQCLARADDWNVCVEDGRLRIQARAEAIDCARDGRLRAPLRPALPQDGRVHVGRGS